MANILTFTEQFGNTSGWTVSGAGLTVTQDTTSRPDFVGLVGNDADTLDDASNTVQGQLYQNAPKASNDTSDWIFSVYIHKDAITSRCPVLLLGFDVGGTAKYAAMRMNTSTGGSASHTDVGTPAAFGVIDVDALWWRAWLRVADNATGNTVAACSIFPACTSALGSGGDGTVVGNVVIWGANLTKGAAIEDYQPDPIYQVDTEWTSVTTLPMTTVIYSDYHPMGGIAYDYRVLAKNVGGFSQSNTVENVTALEGQAPGAIIRNVRIG